MKRIVISLLAVVCGSFMLSAALSVNSTVPADGATKVATGSKIVYVFNENIALNNGGCTLNGAAITPTITGKYLIFSPQMDFFTDYCLIIPEDAIKSSSGEIFKGDTLRYKTAPTPMPKGCHTDVSPIGAGAYTSIQAAIDAAPANKDERHVIFVREGDYHESVRIPADKKNITLWGEHLSHTVLHQATSTPTLHIEGEGCYVFNLSIRNQSENTLATAVQVDGDKTMLRYCEIAGREKSLNLNKVRAYFYQCYIEGIAPIIHSEASAYFDYCRLNTSISGPMVVAKADKGQKGLVFNNCELLSSASEIIVGKALNNNTSISYQQSIFPSAVSKQIWDRNGQDYAHLTEYMNFGPGAGKIDGINYLPSSEIEHYNILNTLKNSVVNPENQNEWNPFTTLSETGGKADTWLEGDGLGANRGGNGGQTVTVNSVSELNKYATAKEPYIIQIDGILSNIGGAISIASDKTICGVDETSTYLGNLRIHEGVSNVIIKYLNISHPGELKANDGISMEGAHRVLVHHVSFYDCSDGCCDMRNSTDSVTFSWNQLYYEKQTDGHRFTMIADGAMVRDANGLASEFLEPLQITLHHNWWSTLCDQRMPSSTNAQAHLYNNYWSCNGNYYASLARDNSHFYSENNYYKGVRNPLYKGDSPSNRIYSDGNIFDTCKDKMYKGKDDVKTPDYKYLKGITKDVPGIVSARAGNVWIDTNYQPTGLQDNRLENKALVTASEKGFKIYLPAFAEKNGVHIYNIQGKLLYQNEFPQTQEIDIPMAVTKGVYLIKVDNGRNDFAKVIIR